jgi:hypothetical protein
VFGGAVCVNFWGIIQYDGQISRLRCASLEMTRGAGGETSTPEILTTENHKGKGCTILFNNLHAEFVKTEELGELNWGNGK